MSITVIKDIVTIYEPGCRTFIDRSLRRTLVLKEMTAAGRPAETRSESKSVRRK